MRSRASLLAVGLAAGCAAEPAGEIGAGSAALTPVTWTDLFGVIASGNDLTKTAAQTAFNAGAVSIETLSGDGYVEFTTGENTSDKLAGLSLGSAGQGYQEVDFAIRLNASGRASVYESGVNRGGIGPYVAGDMFRIEVEAGVVTYWRNGALKYTSAVTASFPLVVDTSLRTPGATLEDVALEGVLFWGDAVRVAASGNDLVKTSTLGSWSAGAVSLATIPSGDGYVQFSTGETDTAKMAGLSNGNGGQSYTDIDFAISLSDTGGVAVYEGGSQRGNFGSYGAGDVFQVRVVSGVVTYWRNGVSFYTSVAAPTWPLLLDTSLRTTGATILDAAIGTGAPPDCTPEEQILLGAAAGERFGTFDVSGDVMVVADIDNDTTAATVYRRSASDWAFEQALPADAAGTGWRVATDGQTIAALVTPTGSTQRVAQIYRHDGAQWVSDGLLLPCPQDAAGFANVAVQGDLLALAVDESQIVGTSGGRIYVHRLTGGSWVLEAILTHDTLGAQLRRLPHVAVSGDWIVGASRYELHFYRYNAGLPDPPGPPSCSSLETGKWRYRTTLVPEGFDSIGLAAIDISASGSRVVAGESVRENVFVFDRTAGVWSQTANLRAFPAELTLGDNIAIGGPDPDGATVVVSGPRVFAEDETGWRQIDVLPSSSGSRGVTSDEILVGASLDDTGGTDAGAIRVFGMEPACFPE